MALFESVGSALYDQLRRKDHRHVQLPLPDYQLVPRQPDALGLSEK